MSVHSADTSTLGRDTGLLGEKLYKVKQEEEGKF